MGPCAARRPARAALSSTTGSFFPQIQEDPTKMRLNVAHGEPLNSRVIFMLWWKHTGAAPLMANRLTPAPWQSRIRPNPSQSGTRSHSVEYSSKLRDTQGHSRGGRYSNQDGVQSACNPLGTPPGTPRCHLRETHGNHSHSQ